MRNYFAGPGVIQPIRYRRLHTLFMPASRPPDRPYVASGGARDDAVQRVAFGAVDFLQIEIIL